MKVLSGIPSPKAGDRHLESDSPVANPYLPGSLCCLLPDFPPDHMIPSCWDTNPLTSSVLSVAISA